MTSFPKRPFASFWRRAFAYGIDTVVIALLNVSIVFSFHRNPFQFPSGTSIPLIVLTIFEPLIFAAVVTPLVWYFMQGQSPGKKLMRIRIVKADLTAPDLITAYLRYFGTYISTLIGHIGFLWMLFDANKQTWHDKIARTYVIESEDTPPAKETYIGVGTAYLCIIAGFMILTLTSTGVITSLGDVRGMYDSMRELSAIEMLKPDVRIHWDKALAIYHPLWDLDFTDPQVIKVARPQLKAAVDELKLARDLDPKNAIIYMRLGDIYERIGGDNGPGSMYTSYMAAFTLDPKNGDYATKVGDALLKLDHPQDAITYYNKSLELYGKYRYAYKGLGEAYLRLGQYDLARENFTKAIVDFTRYNAKGSYTPQIIETQRELKSVPNK